MLGKYEWLFDILLLYDVDMSEATLPDLSSRGQ